MYFSLIRDVALPLIIFLSFILPGFQISGLQLDYLVKITIFYRLALYVAVNVVCRGIKQDIGKWLKLKEECRVRGTGNIKGRVRGSDKDKGIG